MPLGDGAPRVGQHVGPMAELRARAVEAHEDLADGIVFADLVIVQNGDHDLHFLPWGGGRGGTRGEEQERRRRTNG